MRSVRLLWPQGLKNSPAVWQWVIKWVLGGVRDVWEPYMHDIIIGTQQKEGMSDQDLIVVEV